MAQNINKFVVSGNLTKDPEARQYGNEGKEVVTLRIACNRRAPRGGGESKADFFDIKAFDGLGATCKQYLAKGRKVIVSGRVQIDQVPSKDDPSKNLYFTSVIAEDVEFVGGRDDAAPAPATAGGSTPQDQFNDF